MALLVWSLVLLVDGGGNVKFFVAGVLGGLVSFWRPEMLVLLVSAVPMLWRVRQAWAYAIGVVLG